ncbi:MAG: hypothetical protein HQL44_17025 [Alphaproteobacteria bacterium]|nr:hypothetical protein [Alphaproteobacteria bacterium]
MPPLVTIFQKPPSRDEWMRLRRLWRSPDMLKPAEILRRMNGRTARDLLLMLDVILGPGREDVDGAPGFDARVLVALAGRAQPRFDLPSCYELDGRPADWAMVAKAANVVLRGLKFPIVDGPWERMAA